MPQYYYLKKKFRKVGDRGRVVENLERLRAQLDRDIPDKDAEQNLLLATWNIRDFAKTNRRGFGNRLPESHFYIAEIISRFDFVAVQEVNELDEWETVMRILGPDWRYIATDVTDTALGGNGERLLYVYDTRKVWFQNIAGEIVLPNSMLVSKGLVEIDGKKLYTGKQFRRTPYVASFQSGWFKFAICTVHIYYGSESGEKLRERIEEIDRIAKYFGKRADKSLVDGRALILLGDFNIVNPDHDTMASLQRYGFVVPSSLDRPSNLNMTKYYDQIAFKTSEEVIRYIDQPAASGPANSGIFEMFESVFRETDFGQYGAKAAKSRNGRGKTGAVLKKYYEDAWKTYQISDHKPMWVRIDTNAAAEYLESLKAGAQRTTG